MEQNIVNNFSTTIITIMKDTISNYENSVEEIKRIEDELQDLVHEIEMASPKDMYKGWLLYRDMRELRIRRRECKERIELLKDLYDYFKSPAGQGIKTKMQQVQSNSAKVYDAQKKRTYKPRQRTDLTITDKTCEAYKPFQEMLDDFNKNKAHVVKGKNRK